MFVLLLCEILSIAYTNILIPSFYQLLYFSSSHLNFHYLFLILRLMFPLYTFQAHIQRLLCFLTILFLLLKIFLFFSFNLSFSSLSLSFILLSFFNCLFILLVYSFSSLLFGCNNVKISCISISYFSTTSLLGLLSSGSESLLSKYGKFKTFLP